MNTNHEYTFFKIKNSQGFLYFDTVYNGTLWLSFISSNSWDSREAASSAISHLDFEPGEEVQILEFHAIQVP